MVLAVSLNVCFAESTVNQFNLVERYNALVSKTEKFTNVVVSSSPFPSYQYFFDNEIIVDCMSYNENTFSLSIHIDKSNNDIIAVQAYLDEELVSASPNENGAINSIITSLLAAFCEFDDKEINLTVSKIFDDRGNMQEDVRFYRSGFVFEIGFIQNVYQLLMWLGGSFSTLTEYEPEIIQDGNNAPILRWETKNAYFSIKSNSLPGIEDWRLNKVQNFVVYKK